MKLETKKFLYDIHRAALLVREFTLDQKLTDYTRDSMMRAAVEREFEIIGEAMKQLARIDSPVISRISDYQRIISFRNVLIHNYADVDSRLVWDVVVTKLPILIHEVEALLTEPSE